MFRNRGLGSHDYGHCDDRLHRLSLLSTGTNCGCACSSVKQHAILLGHVMSISHSVEAVCREQTYTKSFSAAGLRKKRGNYLCKIRDVGWVWCCVSEWKGYLLYIGRFFSRALKSVVLRAPKDFCESWLQRPDRTQIRIEMHHPCLPY